MAEKGCMHDLIAVHPGARVRVKMAGDDDAFAVQHEGRGDLASQGFDPWADPGEGRHVQVAIIAPIATVEGKNDWPSSSAVASHQR